eukprot:jgi/Astpho2/785/Aster-x0454
MEEQKATIYVGGLSFDSDEQALHKFFLRYGEVKSTKVVVDHETNRSKGFGFVTFIDPRDAADAVHDARGKVLDGAIIRVNVAKYPRGGGPPSRGVPAPLGAAQGQVRKGMHFQASHWQRVRAAWGPVRYGSPGRLSPGRYTPDRYSGDYSHGSGRSRSRSYSAGPRRRGTKRRADGSPSYSGRSYSRSGSYDSYSDSGSEGGRGPRSRRQPPMPRPEPGAPAVAPAAVQSLQAELDAARQRESELTSRIAALESRDKSTGGTEMELQQQFESRLKKSNDVCSQYRKWLSAVSECTKALTASKTRLEEAKKDMAEREEDLNILVNEAGTFMQKEQARAAKRAKRHAQRDDGQAGNGVAEGDEGMGPQEVPEGADDVAEKFKPGIKFRLAA